MRVENTAILETETDVSDRTEPAAGVQRRGRVLNAALVTFVLLTFSSGLFFHHMGAALLSWICLGAAFLGILNFLLFRWTENLLASGNTAVFLLWGTLALIRWTGGPVSADGLILLAWVWNAVVILLGIFLSGYRWGSLWACLVFLESGLSIHLFRTGYAFGHSSPFDISTPYALGFHLMGLLAVLLLAFLYEKEREETLLREEGKAAALKGSKRALQALLEPFPDPFFVVDRKHRVLQWNRACSHLSGIAANDIIGRPVWRGFFLDEEGSLADKLLDDPEGILKKYDRDGVSRTEYGSFALRGSLPNLKGLYTIMKASPIVGPDGSVMGAIQSIQTNGSSMGSVLVSAGVERGTLKPSFPAFRVDPVGKISSWNEGCERIFGYPAAQVLGTSPLSFVTEPYRKRFEVMLLNVLGGEPWEGSAENGWECRSHEGKNLFILADAYPLTATGEIRGCTIIPKDVTPLFRRLAQMEGNLVEYREIVKRTLEDHDLLKRNIASFIRGKE
jgi:PAS domain S-box-containing protein